ncbi:hypothetical protein, variant [Aphanomyces astaci]|uniref:Rieske domain-containing protein n=1 Tax=Aphanomyces astaci TaxID=112090 RepID=W4H6R0_APHAT|nr:hypothetical protein, variant [Aphanomyces astaci]ETV87710.1 hypothetical protein, variant [Aphanomyces astaci]|eukprot:XP_009822573.1 hypothetical protein, variant [Aphanomyces astaci]
MKMALAVRRLSHQPQQPPRVIASLRSLRALPPSKALKFRWKGNVDGFVFLSGDTPHAYANRCSHVALELDLNDADFFSHGFIQCKVHGAMFDPESGLCLRPPPQCKRLHVRCLMTSSSQECVAASTDTTCCGGRQCAAERWPSTCTVTNSDI